MKYTIPFCIGFLFIQVFTLNAQSFRPPKIDTLRFPKPKVMLFMLHLSTNKIEALRKRGLQEDIPSVKAGDAEINNSIISDFSQHFTFCPVYFFYDTCIDLVKAKRWQEVEFYDYESLNKKKKIATANFDTYYFAEVSYKTPDEGLPIDSTIPEAAQDGSRGDQDVVASRNYGINLYDENFKPIRNKLGFTDISLRQKGPLFGKKKFEFIGAAIFDKKLRRLYAPPIEE